MKKKYIIFDFDGTLLNTNDIIIDTWNATAEHFLGKKFTEEEIIGTFGETIKYTISHMFPDNDLEEVVEFYKNWQFANCEGRIHLFDGVKEMLEELKKSGHRLFLVTSRTKEGTAEYLKKSGISELFEAVVTPGDCPEHKPSTAPLKMALEAVADENPQPEDCIMIGDTYFDVGCANNAGIDGVLTEWGHPANEETLTMSGFVPKYRVKSIEEFMELVR